MPKTEKQKKLIASALRRLEQMEMVECFDSTDTSTRPTAKQLEILRDIGSVYHRYVTAGNQSGKTAIGAREISWLFLGNHPHFELPERWRGGPLLMLVLGRTTRQLEDTIWRKISGFLPAGSYRLIRQGGAIQKVEHLENGNTILFLSHHNENEAREKAQSFVAHYVWLDEMPGSMKLIEELHRRIQAMRGRFLATFTPKIINNEIRKLVDSSRTPLSKKYRLHMFDNPIYSEEDKANILASLETASPTYRETVLSGEWMLGEEAVYQFIYDLHVEAPDPTRYSPSWRHVEAVDPAVKSKMGYTLWAEDPKTDLWYCVRAEYIEGIYVPEQILDSALARSSNYNVVRRISDYEPWYVETASHRGVRPAYLTPFDKNSRKGELIKGLQQKLGTRLRIAPWCADLIDEFMACRWSETAVDKIVNSSSYHLLDSSQYFADLMPKPTKDKPVGSWDTWLYEANQKRKRGEERKKKIAVAGRRPRIGRKRWQLAR